MTYRSLQQGIEAIQQGRTQEGARLIKIALKSDEVKDEARSMAWVWLAETTDNPNEKMRHYNQALAADPNNQHAHQRIAMLMASGLSSQDAPAQDKPAPPPQAPPEAPSDAPGKAPERPPSPPETSLPAQPVDYNNINAAAAVEPQYNPNALYRTVSIIDGVNGPGTAFFVTRDGLLATTRYVVGGMREVTYELQRGQRGTGQVARSFPEQDLALIRTGVSLNQILPFSNTDHLPDNTPLTTIAHNGTVINGVRRATKSKIPEGWFPTDINVTDVPDAGGAPIFNPQNVLVGMLTRNANRSAPYVFGLHIGVINRLVEKFAQETQAGPDLVYCTSCGHLSRAASLGGFYCEWCGSTLPTAEDAQRFPIPQMSALYGETMSRPCPECSSTVGFYQGKCLRCGYEMPRQR